MNRFIITSGIAVLVSQANLFGSVLSGAFFNPSTGHSYLLLSDNTWTASEAEAVTLGGHLVTINNDAENTWVFNTFGAGSIPLWIGFTDQASEGNFSWISGETPAFTKWSPGEPNDGFGDEEYGYIIENGAPFGLQAGFWNDAPNLTPNFPIYGVVEVPEPSALSLLVAAAGCVLGLRRKSRA